MPAASAAMIEDGVIPTPGATTLAVMMIADTDAEIGMDTMTVEAGEGVEIVIGTEDMVVGVEASGRNRLHLSPRSESQLLI